jgi:hypothetical protein
LVLSTQIAIRNLRKQPTPKEVNLKAVVIILDRKGLHRQIKINLVSTPQL